MAVVLGLRHCLTVVHFLLLLLITITIIIIIIIITATASIIITIVIIIIIVIVIIMVGILGFMCGLDLGNAASQQAAVACQCTRDTLDMPSVSSGRCSLWW